MPNPESLKEPAVSPLREHKKIWRNVHRLTLDINAMAMICNLIDHVRSLLLLIPP